MKHRKNSVEMRIPATLVRGGTSKCWLFSQVHVPPRRSELERLLVDVYGAADPVQLDGVGGATPTTSKAAVVGVSSQEAVNIDYLFAQVGIGTETVEWGSNCGNCATGVALYAVAKGLVPITGDLTRVVMRNTNTGAILEAVVDTAGGVVHEFGAQTVPGTRSGGVAVGLTFLEPAGRSTGALLPTGAAAELMEIDERSGTLRVSMADAGAPVVLIDAVSAGRTGAETLERLNADIPWLRAVRRAAASRMGLSKPGQDTGDAVPKVGLVGPPVSYTQHAGRAHRGGGLRHLGTHALHERPASGDRTHLGRRRRHDQPDRRLSRLRRINGPRPLLPACGHPGWCGPGQLRGLRRERPWSCHGATRRPPAL